jgi:hypothetical protein
MAQRRIVIPCDVCQTNVATPERYDTVWVRWWERHEEARPESRAVVAFDVVCVGECSNREIARRRAELRAPGAWVHELDGYLGWSAGRWAIVQLAQLMRDYTWSDRAALERCLDFFVRASRLPDGSGPPSFG